MCDFVYRTFIYVSFIYFYILIPITATTSSNSTENRAGSRWSLIRMCKKESNLDENIRELLPLQIGHSRLVARVADGQQKNELLVSRSRKQSSQARAAVQWSRGERHKSRVLKYEFLFTASIFRQQSWSLL